MLLGIPFHISLIYSTIHGMWIAPNHHCGWPFLMTSSARSACRYFSLYPATFPTCFFYAIPWKKWWKVRVETCRYPDVNSHPPTDITAIYYAAICQRKSGKLAGLSLYDKYNTLAWELISHLWFLLVLVVMTTLCVWIFKRIRNNLENSDKTNKKFSMVKLSVIFLCLASVMR